MADEWVSVRANLADDPKTWAVVDWLAAHKPFRDWLGVTVDKLNRNALVSVTVTAFIRVWSLGNSRGFHDGDDVLLLHANLKWIDEVGKIPGLGTAMDAVGWAHEDEIEGVKAVRLPNFGEYNKTVEERSEAEKKRREQNRERQKRFRNKRNGNVTNALHNAPTAEQSTAENSTDAAATAQCMDRGYGGKVLADRRFIAAPVPGEFLATLDTIQGILQATDPDQIGFLAKLAYADAVGFEFTKPIWDYVGRARPTRGKRVPNPAGYLTNAIREDLGPERWQEFQEQIPSPAHCQWILAQAGREQSA